MTTPPFHLFIKNPWASRLLTFDPGETTGYSIWDNCELTECGQLNTHYVQSSVLWLDEWIWGKLPSVRGPSKGIYKVVIEEYRVYSQKAEDHAQSTMHTSRLIGCLETLLTLRGIQYEMCGAGLAKRFATDQKLKDWGFWQRGERHARDAIRHGIYNLCKDPPK